MAKNDYYDLLGVTKTASDDELKQAYRKRAMECHPDRNPNDAQAEARFKEVNEAYDVLKDTNKRGAYDQYGHDAFQQGAGGASQGFGDMSDIFEEMFSGFMGGGRGRSRQAKRGDDLRFDLNISLEEAYHGKSEEIKFTAEMPCEKCSGTGAVSQADIVKCATCNGNGVVEMRQGFFRMQQDCPKCKGKGTTIKQACQTCRGSGANQTQRKIKVDIPAGVENGNRIRISGEGNPGKNGAPKGDLYVFVTLRDHDLFKRDGKMIWCQLPIDMAKAALGNKIEVPTLDGGKVRLEIPAGTQHGQQFRLRSKGMVGLYGRGSIGDMIVEMNIEIPKNISKKQRELLEEFEKNTDPSSNSTNFWENVSNFWKNNAKD